MINIKNISLFLCLFFLSGCANVRTYNKKEFEQKEKSVVFFDIQQEEGESKYSLLFRIKKYGSDDDKEILLYVSNYENPEKEQSIKDKLMFLEPGIYHISYISFWSSYCTVGSGLEDGIVQYGAFEVKAGEVINVQKLIFKQDSKEFYLEDNYSTIKQQLKECKDPEIAELADKIIKSKFYSRGSMLILGKGNKPKLIPAEVVFREYQKIMQERGGQVKNFVR